MLKILARCVTDKEGWLLYKVFRNFFFFKSAFLHWSVICITLTSQQTKVCPETSVSEMLLHRFREGENSCCNNAVFCDSRIREIRKNHPDVGGGYLLVFSYTFLLQSCNLGRTPVKSIGLTRNDLLMICYSINRRIWFNDQNPVHSNNGGTWNMSREDTASTVH